MYTQMKVGSIHKNSKTRYFAVGGYFSYEYDDDFKITYYDSKTNYGIQLADLIVNTFYNSYKNIKLVEKVIKELKPKNFRVSLFPRNSKNKK